MPARRQFQNQADESFLLHLCVVPVQEQFLSTRHASVMMNISVTRRVSVIHLFIMGHSDPFNFHGVHFG